MMKITEALRPGQSSEIFETDGIAEDVTEAIMAGEVIREQETLYRTLFYQLNQGMLLVNREGEILVANNAICRLTGKEEGCQNMLGENVLTFLTRRRTGKLWIFSGDDATTKRFLRAGCTWSTMTLPRRLSSVAHPLPIGEMMLSS